MFVAQIIIILGALAAVTANDCGYNQLLVNGECLGKYYLNPDAHRLLLDLVRLSGVQPQTGQELLGLCFDGGGHLRGV